MPEPKPTNDLQLLLEARLFVARLGESDVHRWWRTDGILGEDGAFVGPRVLPKTHGTGRARIAFAVARHACRERHPDPSAQNLFHLDPETEDRFDAYLVERLDAFEWWADILSRLEGIKSDADPSIVLNDAKIIGDDEVGYVSKRKLGPDNRSLSIESAGAPDQTIRRLAAGFIRSKSGELAVPFVQSHGSGV